MDAEWPWGRINTFRVVNYTQRFGHGFKRRLCNRQDELRIRCCEVEGQECHGGSARKIGFLTGHACQQESDREHDQRVTEAVDHGLVPGLGLERTEPRVMHRVKASTAARCLVRP